MFEKVLFPIEPFLRALEGAKKALELVISQRSQLILLSVDDANFSYRNRTLTAGQSFCETVVTHFQEAGVVVEAVQRAGNPAVVICDLADERNVDLILMGAKGINLEDEWESTPARVIQLAPCPVLVVP